MFSKKATEIDEIFTVDLTLFGKCQIDGEDFVKFCGLLKNTNFTLQKESINRHEHLLLQIWHLELNNLFLGDFNVLNQTSHYCKIMHNICRVMSLTGRTLY